MLRLVMLLLLQDAHASGQAIDGPIRDVEVIGLNLPSGLLFLLTGCLFIACAGGADPEPGRHAPASLRKGLPIQGSICYSPRSQRVELVDMAQCSCQRACLRTYMQDQKRYLLS